MDYDRIGAFALIIILCVAPIIVGVYNDWKRSPRRRANHPSIRPLKDDES